MVCLLESDQPLLRYLRAKAHGAASFWVTTTEAPPFHNRFGAFCTPSSLVSSQKTLAGTKERDSQRARGASEIIRYMEGTVPLWRDNDTWLAPPLGICPFLCAQNA
eukprot:scaffold21358_cov133-Amphora_coffeaeformis.AAC.1